MQKRIYVTENKVIHLHKPDDVETVEYIHYAEHDAVVETLIDRLFRAEKRFECLKSRVDDLLRANNELVNLWNNTTDQQDINADLLEVLKECLPRIEEIRLVDLGAVRDAEMQDYNERKILTRRELAKTNELINKISKAISRAEQKQMEKK